MKLLATSDLHNRHDWYAWLHNKAPQYDAVVIAGDLLDNRRLYLDEATGQRLPSFSAFKVRFNSVLNGLIRMVS